MGSLGAPSGLASCRGLFLGRRIACLTSTENLLRNPFDKRPAGFTIRANLTVPAKGNLPEINRSCLTILCVCCQSHFLHQLPLRCLLRIWQILGKVVAA